MGELKGASFISWLPLISPETSGSFGTPLALHSLDFEMDTDDITMSTSFG